jgi:hypothetical protein
MSIYDLFTETASYIHVYVYMYYFMYSGMSCKIHPIVPATTLHRNVKFWNVTQMYHSYTRQYLL